MAQTEAGGKGLADRGSSTGSAGDTEASSKAMRPPRSRRLHTRSRAGCITCRKRHVKCDEARPICINCKTGSRDCVYPDVSLTLRDRRAKEHAIPGAQVVWSINASETSSSSSKTPSNDSGSTRSLSPPSSSTPMKQLLLNHRGIDPFDTLGIKMQFKSRELLHYFYHTADAFGIATKDANKDCLALVAHDPAALRSTLLVAGVHYSWNVGQLAAYEQTYLSTKIDAIHSVNEWIRSGKESAFVNCVRQVATLCLSECCGGNIPLAEAHLDGLTALMEANQNRRGPTQTLDNELSDRYIILVYNFVHGFKSRLTDILHFDADYYDPTEATEEEASALMHSHHASEMDGLDIRLKALRLIPHFFAPPHPGTKVKDVDIERFLLSMDQLTRMECRRQNARKAGSWDTSWNILWMEGAPTRLFHAFVDAHAKSFSTEPESADGAPGFRGLQSSWLGISTAAGLYLYGVLGFWNAGAPMKTRLLVQILAILMRDIDATWTDGQTNAHVSESEFWFWKVFSGACAVWRTMDTMPAEERSDALEAKKARLVECVKHWSSVTGTMMWEGARAALMRIVWMPELDSDAMGRKIWDECITDR